MPPRVFLLRHGEAQHNVGPPPPPDHDLLDPELTSRGITQCQAIPNTYPHFFASLSPDNTLIIVSPLRRTIQTLLLGFSAHLPHTNDSTETPSIPLKILPELQECGSWPCDTGGPLSLTKARFASAPFLDWSECEAQPDWNLKRGKYEATEEKNVVRAKWIRRWIRERKEDKVVLVGHHGILRRIVKAPNAHDRLLSPIQWENAELREFAFKDLTGEDDEADLVRVAGSIL
ncbi:hypothetical protein JCM21900_002365 [Sporobolomyces salmonicolor]